MGCDNPVITGKKDNAGWAYIFAGKQNTMNSKQ